MLNKSLVLLTILFLSVALNTNAVEEPATYREPTDLTDEEWNQINDEIRVYNSCLRQEMVKWTQQGTDPRAVSDQVLDVCSIHLIELQNDMDKKNINPHFTERYIYASKNKAARKMLGAIMMLMSQQQNMQKTDSDATQEPEVNTNPE